MVYIVKGRLVTWSVAMPNPLDPEGSKLLKTKMAFHGQRVSTEPEGDDPNVIYGLNEIEEARLLAEPSNFFSQAEIDAMNAGVTDDLSLVEGSPESPRGDTHTSIPTMADPDGSPVTAVGGSGTPHPLSFEEMAPWQIAGYIKDAGLGADEIISIVEANPLLAPKFMTALTDSQLGLGKTGDDPEVEALAELQGVAVRGPEGSEGIEMTLPADVEPLVSSEEPTGAPVPEAPNTSERPSNSASRGEWDAYAATVVPNYNTASYANKDEVIQAADDAAKAKAAQG